MASLGSGEGKMNQDKNPPSHTKRAAKEIAQFRNNIIPELARIGVEKLTIHYSGSGDEGLIDGIDVEPAEIGLPQELSEQINTLAEDFLYAEHGSWGDGDGATGTVVVLPFSGKVVNEHGWYFTDIEYETREF